jgi:hypothetical protein
MCFEKVVGEVGIVKCFGRLDWILEFKDES